jgi:hypothetical protein
VDFATVLSQACQKPVVAAPLARLAETIRKDEVNAYYTEMPVPNDEAAQQLNAVRVSWGKKFVFCFDEILNRERDGLVTQRIKDLLQAIVDEGRTPGYSYMILLQNMTELFKPVKSGPAMWAGAEGKWPGIPGQATFFLRPLNDGDAGIYTALCDAKRELFETDEAEISFKRLKKAPYGEMLVVQPYRQSTEKPIAVEIRSYELFDTETRNSYSGKLQWGSISYAELKTHV